MIKLILEEAGGFQTLELDRDELTIGRTADNAVRVQDSLSSRKHCKLEKTPDGWVVEDLKSRNGTTLNGATVSGRKVLTVGDRIAIGLSTIHFGAKLDDAEAPAQKKPAAKAAQANSGGEPKASAGTGRDSKVAPNAKTARKVRFILKGQEGARAGKALGVPGFPFTIGKKKGLSLTIDDDESMGDEHCMLVMDGGTVHLVDLNSESGTTVDGKRVRGREALHAGALVVIGKTRFKWKDLLAKEGDAKTTSDDDLDQVAPSKRFPEAPKSDAPDDDGAQADPKPAEAKRPSEQEKRAPEKEKLAQADRASAQVDKAPAKPAKADSARAGKAAVDVEVTDLDALGEDDDDPAATPSVPINRATIKRALEKEPVPIEPRKTGKPTSDRHASPEKRAKPTSDRAAPMAPESAIGLPEDTTGISELGELPEDLLAPPPERGGFLAALAIIVLVLALAGTVVAVAASTLSHDDPDPNPDDNNLVSNWSFEASPALSGWSGHAKVVTEGVQYGKHAVSLDAASADTHDELVSDGFAVTPGKALSVHAACRSQGQAAGVLVVRWGDDPSSPEAYAAIVDGSSEWQDVGESVIVPPNVTQAHAILRAVALGQGPGSVQFDRVSVAPEEAPQTPLPSLDGAGLNVQTTARGVLRLARKGPDGSPGRTFAEIQTALAGANGERGSPLGSEDVWQIVTPGSELTGSLTAEGKLLDLPTGQRVSCAVELKPSVGESLRYRVEIPKLELPQGRALRVSVNVPDVGLVRPVTLAGDDGSSYTLDEAAGKPGLVVREIIWFEGEDQSSLTLIEPLALYVLQPKTGMARSGVVLDLVGVPVLGKNESLSLDLELRRASSLASGRVLKLLQKASDAVAAGHLEEARQAYEAARAASDLARDPQAAASAEAQAAELTLKAKRLLASVTGISKNLDAVPVPALVDAARFFQAQLASSFAGASEAQDADAAVKHAQAKLAEGSSDTRRTESQALITRAVTLEKARRNELAKAIFGYVKDAFPPDDPSVAEASDGLRRLDKGGS